MHASILAANPFGLLTDPQAVIDAMEKSTRLGSLNRRICRPLDRPAPGSPGTDAAAQGDASVNDGERDELGGLIG
jgi:hypothetical protein